MEQLLTLEILARGGAVGAFVGLAILCAPRARTPAGLTAALFCLAAAAHTLTQVPDIVGSLGWAVAPVWALSVMGAGLFWAFALELFEDRAKLDPIRLAPAALLLAVGLAAAMTGGAAARTLLLLHNIAGAALIAHALFRIAAGWRGDLVEARRRLRGPVLVVAAIYALAVIAVQTGELFLGSAQPLSPIAALALLALALLGLAAFGRVDAELFGAAKETASDEPPPPSDAPLIVGEDAAAATNLDRLMRVERLYREEGLTISALALRLKTPEHKLRRLINQRLGHRNFSAFLNQWRLADAKAALADPAQREVPISTIALDSGFASLGPFNRAFKAETGKTPSDYRAQALAAPPR